MIRRCASLVCLFVAFGLGLAPAQTTGVAGQVVSADATPISGAEVTLWSAQHPSTTTLTDASGRFEFSGLAPGRYHVTAVALGLSPASQEVSVPADVSSDLTLQMLEAVRERVNVVGDRADKIPGSATVIDRREMEKVKLATDDVHQMLRQVPGLNIQEEEGYGLRPNIGMRGSGTDRSSKITLMEDGVLIAPAPYAAPAAYYAPTAGRMESLEVRKGSSQIKYGPMTNGGALNYVSTSIPSDLQLHTSLLTGGDRTRKLTANIGDSYGNLGWLVETFQFRNDGFKELDGGGDTGVDLADYMAKLRFQTTPTETTYQEVEIKLGRTEQLGDETYLGLTDADFGVTPRRRYAASQVDVFDSTHTQYQARHFLARRHWDLTTTVYRNNFRREWYKLQSVLGSGLAGVLQAPDEHPAEMAVLTGADSAAEALMVRNNDRSYYGAGVQSVLGMSVARGPLQHQLEVGVRYHQDEEDRFQQEDAYRMVGGRMVMTRAGAPGSQANQVGTARAVAGFVSDTISWGPWSVSPGIRYERIELGRTTYAGTDRDRTGAAEELTTTVDAFIPGVGISYAARPDVTLFGGVHRGFAPPGPGAVDGTRVEESLNYELGARATRGDLRTELVGFVNDYGNLLGRDSLATGGSGEGELFNGGEARIYGLEASAQWNAAKPLGLTFDLPLRAAYTFTDAEFRNSFESQFGPWGDVQLGDDLPYVPRHQLYASVEADHQAWRARLEATYVGRMRTVAGQGAFVTGESTDAYLVLSLSGEYPLASGASLFASVQNLTDSMHIVGRHPAGVRPGLPRYVQVGLKFSLGR